MTLHARWVVPVGSAPIESGYVSVADGHVIEVGAEASAGCKRIDFGDAIILPGFVNAHTHLELTSLRGRVPFSESFAKWLRVLTQLNPHRDGDDAVRQSVRGGIRECLAAGTTTVADIGYGQVVPAEWARSPLNTVGFLEVIGIGEAFKAFTKPDRSVEAVEGLLAEADRLVQDGGPLRCFGITPHAPYSTDEDSYRAAIDFARRTRRPIATHLAETRDEERFLRDGTGSFRELLEEFGLWDDTFNPPGCSPIEYMKRVGLFDLGSLAVAPLLAHVNYVSDRDLDLLAASSASVVYCPRTHHFFRHEPHRYRDMLSRGINVCLGTDSLASNDTLSILDELRFLRSRDADITNAQLLDMATLAGARALGQRDHVGVLATGMRADFVVIPLADPHTPDPLDDLLRSDTQPSHVFIGGMRVFPFAD